MRNIERMGHTKIWDGWDASVSIVRFVIHLAEKNVLNLGGNQGDLHLCAGRVVSSCRMQDIKVLAIIGLAFVVKRHDRQ